MRKRYNKVLCYILIVLMLFLGMCLENTKADSFFGCTLIELEASSIDAQDLGKGIDNSCTTEMLQKNEKLVVKNAAKHILNRKSGKETAFLLSAQFMTHCFSYAYDTLLLQLPENCSNSFVLHYIHDKDGEK